MDLSADYGTSNEACGCGGGEGVVVVVGGLLCTGGAGKGGRAIVVVVAGVLACCGGIWLAWRGLFEKRLRGRLVVVAVFFWRVVNKKKNLWLLSGKAVCNRWNRWSLIVFHFVLNSLGGEPGGRNGIIWRESIYWFRKIRQGYGR